MTYPHRAPDDAFAAAADARGVGELGGGWIFDRFGGYAWLYIGSFALGLGAPWHSRFSSRRC